MFFATESAARKSRKQRIRHEGCALVLHCASQGTKKIETDFTDPTRGNAVKNKMLQVSSTKKRSEI